MKHEFVFKNHHRITIHLIGCGGTGSQMLTGLARMNAALKALGKYEIELYAFDDDMVSPANVGRQLFSRSDIGQYKSTVLINRLNQYFGSQWVGVREKFNIAARSYMERADITISCVDTRKARKEIFKQIRGKAMYWMDLGNTNHSGQAILGNADYSERGSRTKSEYTLLPTVAHLFPEIIDDQLPEDDMPSCSLAEALEKQDLMVNQMVSTNALELLWQLLRKGEIENHGFFFNAEKFNLQPMAVDRGKWQRMLRQAKKYGKKQESEEAA